MNNLEAVMLRLEDTANTFNNGGPRLKRAIHRWSSLVNERRAYFQKGADMFDAAIAECEKDINNLVIINDLHLGKVHLVNNDGVIIPTISEM